MEWSRFTLPLRSLTDTMPKRYRPGNFKWGLKWEEARATGLTWVLASSVKRLFQDTRWMNPEWELGSQSSVHHLGGINQLGFEPLWIVSPLSLHRWKSKRGLPDGEADYAQYVPGAVAVTESSLSPVWSSMCKYAIIVSTVALLRLLQYHYSQFKICSDGRSSPTEFPEISHCSHTKIMLTSWWEHFEKRNN